MTSALDSGTARAASLGRFYLLPDALTIRCILTLLGPKDLSSLMLTSRYLHVFARNDLVWRRLFFATRDRNSTRLVFRGSWLLTYLFPNPEHDEACVNYLRDNNTPGIQDVSSEFLHHQWLRSNTSFAHFYPPPPAPPTPAIGENRPVNPVIPVENYDDLDQETFYRRYGYPNRPVMIQNSGVESWPAWEQWTLEALAAKHGDTPFRISNIDSDNEPSFRLCFKDFLHYLLYNKDQDPLYLFDPYFADAVPEMELAYEASTRATHSSALCQNILVLIFSRSSRATLDHPIDGYLLDHNGQAPRGTRTLLEHQHGTRSSLDTSDGHCKYPPHMTPPGHDPTSPTRLTSVAWYLDVYPFLPQESRPIEIVQNPGQTIYVPSGWWHMVLNMDHTVAVTQNFADDSNIIQVRQSMQADETETIQIQRWDELAQKLSMVRPDLAPALLPSQEDEQLQRLKAQSSWLDPHSENAADQWHDRVKDIVQRSTGFTNPGEIELIGTGENVCFLTAHGFVKFFTPFHDGHDSFLSEVRANTILAARSAGVKGDVLAPPRMLGYGYLFDDQTEWRWPFIMTETLSARHPVDLVESKEFMPEDESGYSVLLPPILHTLNYCHSLDLTSFLDESQLDTTFDQPRVSLGYTARCLEAAALNHTRWRVFPKHLLKLLPNYLPKDAMAVFDPSKGDAVASLVHGDVNPGNVLGYLDEEDEDFRPLSLIDFGDAVLKADPLIDIVSVFITILNCRQDLGMTKLLLDFWRQLGAKGDQDPKRTLARRCMWHVLLWPSEGLSLHLVRCVPEVGEMTTWEQLEQAIFGWWSAL
ncbi:hypothetical protein KVV02_005985 [Mortierella alpina]|uniref:JmjC domain-containing protein n=1 Tax=Mortierella alpina TaxID=64518 RepID=A0A9P8IER6_MORAP|nr:hypothetical protein KVV02_005985 [Mortierella alpina]